MPKKTLTAVVEIPMGSIYKYEIDKCGGILKIDRTLPFPIPANYGYIKDTLADDGDPLDVFIVSSQPIHPLTEVQIEVVDGYDCYDNGERDEKVIAVIAGSKHVLEPIEIGRILLYLREYKKKFTIKRKLGYNQIIERIKKCKDAFAQENW